MELKYSTKNDELLSLNYLVDFLHKEYEVLEKSKGNPSVFMELFLSNREVTLPLIFKRIKTLKNELGLTIEIA